MQTHTIIATHPDVNGRVNGALVAAIDAALACMQSCSSCAEACLAEDMVTNRRGGVAHGLAGSFAARGIMVTMIDSSMVIFALIGMAAGLLSGLLGIGGGVVIMPALIYFAGFDQHRATGTSLAVLLPPIGIGAAVEYYRHGAVDVRAAAIIAVCVIVFAWLSALLATRVPGDYLRLLFGLFIIVLGGTMAFDAIHKLGWL